MRSLTKTAVLLIGLAQVLLGFSSLAANKYVVPGGSGNGSSWSNAGSTSIINNSAAGDVIYLAGGNYGNGFQITVSGSSSAPLTIKRATATDHGSDTGWQSGMDKQAVFDSGWSILGQYITIDGNCWKPPGLPTKFGILIHHASGKKGLDGGGSNGHWVLRDIDVQGPGINASKVEADGIHFPTSTTISGCSAHDTDVLLFTWKGNNDSVIEYCVLYNASSNIVYSGNSQDPHPDVLYTGGMPTNSIMRWCLVANVTSEGVFFHYELPGDNMMFYGNIMIQGDCQNGNVPIEWQNEGSFGRVFLYHNTFVDFSKSNYLGPGTHTAPGGAVVNNLWINCVTNLDQGVDNNGFSAGPIGTNPIVNPANPFITTGSIKWVKGSGNPPATRVTSGAPIGYNPIGMEAAFALAPNSWAAGKAISVSEGRNVDMFGNSGNNLGAIQGAGGSGPTPTPTPTATPTPPAAKFKAGDTVTPTAVVNVRDAPGGAVVGQHNPGDIGTIISGPVLAPLPQATTVAWYLINWTSAPASGHTGDDDLTKTMAPTPTPTPAPTPTPTPPPSVTYREWTNKLNTNQSDWISKHPPYPDSE